MSAYRCIERPSLCFVLRKRIVQSAEAISEETAPIRLFLINRPNHCHGNNYKRECAHVYGMCVRVRVCVKGRRHKEQKAEKNKRIQMDGDKGQIIFSLCTDASEPIRCTKNTYIDAHNSVYIMVVFFFL